MGYIDFSPAPKAVCIGFVRRMALPNGKNRPVPEARIFIKENFMSIRGGIDIMYSGRIKMRYSYMTISTLTNE